jgi:signal transduction histidine kinase
MDALLEVRHELSQELPCLPIRVSVDGGPRRLSVLVHEQAYCIGREAMSKVARQPHSQCVDVGVHFRPDEFAIIVRDDGCGMAPDRLGFGKETARSDFPDLAERARRIGGRLHVRGGPSGGTEIVLEVPAAAAYVHAKGRWWSPWQEQPR